MASEKDGRRNSSADLSRTEVDHAENHYNRPSDEGLFDSKKPVSQAKAAHPLAGYSKAQLAEMGEKYAREQQGLTTEEDIRAFRIGAIIAGDMDVDDDLESLRNKYASVEGLTEEERTTLVDEVEHKWRNPKMLYFLVTICSLCAVVQGMDETVVNGAQIFYKREFGIDDESDYNTWISGLTNSAPYLCCAVIGCWITEPMNKRFGRRGTVFISCMISFLACFWQAFTNTWWHMFIARFFLGFGIGPKSATTPMFAAECSPKLVRGALVMQWQMWTAFGIMLGYVSDLVFYGVPDQNGITGLNWRLMMGSAGVPALIVCAMVYMCPESPRYYLTKDRHAEAYNSMSRLRFNKIQSARDVFYAHTLLKAEAAMSIGRGNRLKEFFTVRRNRNAMLASQTVMFMQQFFNVIAYYSSEIFLEAGFPEKNALAASLGFGIINFLFAIPAFYTIDTFGRRNLLLTTFPLMSIFLLFTGFSFFIPEDSKAHIGCIALGIYLFGVVYSPGEGPVPFTYSAEAYPLYIRAIGMSLATATTWCFNFILAVTWPSLQKAFKPQGAFGWYAAWNIIGFFLVLLFLPETKGKTLEELDSVFNVRLTRIMRYGIAQFFWFFRHYFLRSDAPKPVVPRAGDEAHDEKGMMQDRDPQPSGRV
ncbi:mfs sugar transporter [Fusarium albosuccineum]|uniref:Mfs sugar transporter n=1 Tax=Fusarium albosuccineum TaxID=1237068 RepID=A0A8H4P102_9HYPO|nr:mfs sugar transporter [Fusarium albosuccineum]